MGSSKWNKIAIEMISGAHELNDEHINYIKKSIFSALEKAGVGTEHYEFHKANGGPGDYEILFHPFVERQGKAALEFLMDHKKLIFMGSPKWVKMAIELNRGAHGLSDDHIDYTEERIVAALEKAGVGTEFYRFHEANGGPWDYELWFHPRVEIKGKTALTFLNNEERLYSMIV